MCTLFWFVWVSEYLFLLFHNALDHFFSFVLISPPQFDFIPYLRHQQAGWCTLLKCKLGVFCCCLKWRQLYIHCISDTTFFRVDTIQDDMRRNVRLRIAYFDVSFGYFLCLLSCLWSWLDCRASSMRDQIFGTLSGPKSGWVDWSEKFYFLIDRCGNLALRNRSLCPKNHTVVSCMI